MVERYVDIVEVISSILITPTNIPLKMTTFSYLLSKLKIIYIIAW